MDGSGRLSLRNRRFLKPIHTEIGKPKKIPLSNFPIPTALSEENTQMDVDNNPTPTAVPICDNNIPITDTSENSEDIILTNPEIRHPNILKSIKDFNKPGHSEGDVPRARLREGKDY